ncbi:MAG: hypothetical protein JRN59_07330 [Nitrososphaerota archaeon]|nr:hypothetical protein [Nitrososphaerota archaeon]
MPRRRKDEIDPLVALLAIIVLGAAFFYLYAIPAIESWWAIYGIWVEVGLVFVAAGGIYFVYWWHKTSVEIDKEVKAKMAMEEEKQREFERTLPGAVIKAIEEFRPSRRYHNEFPYQTELQGWLKSRFPTSQIEFQTGASRPDIVIEDIAIEVKGPTDNRALETLTTKCLKYSGHFSKVILVLFEPIFSESNFSEIEAGIERLFPHVYVVRKD